MRDVNRKVEKFLKAKEINTATTKASSALVPHVIYGVSSAPKTMAKISNNLSTRSFAMTVSFFNPRFEKHTFPKEFAIRHEDKKVAMLATSPDRYSSPSKRDPILQDNSEPVHEPRSCIKFTPLSARTTIFTEEPVYSKKIVGEFNHIYNARSQSPKIESIKTSIKKRSDSPDEPRRQKKFVNTPHHVKPNPITEGDVNGIVIRKERLVPEISEETKKINDRKTLLGSDREESKRGRIFRDSNINFNTEPTAEIDRIDSKGDRGFLGARLGSPTRKPEDSISGLMEYKHALSYRDQGVSDKCTNRPISALMGRPAEV